MPISPEKHAEYKAFADELEHARERECTGLLEYATDLLVPQQPILSIAMTQEQRSPYGRSDYIVVADVRSETGQTERVLIFWELKAPQCFLVEVDDAANRYRPTKDLIKAETQLLHYVHQAAGDSDLRQRFDIRYPTNIRAGGIIIGRDERIFKPANGATSDAANHSLKIRRTHIYDRAQFKVMTWDRILQHTLPMTQE